MSGLWRGITLKLWDARPITTATRAHRLAEWKPWPMATTTEPPASDDVLACPACRVIDRFDGVEDGKIFTPAHVKVTSENRRIAALLDTQDRVADHVTEFAGSLHFVYIHAAWFGVWLVL